MLDEKNLVVLPEREQMLEALLAVCDEEYVVRDFYPLLLAHAGEEKYPQGVLLMVQLAKHDFVQTLPEPFNKVLPMLIETEELVAALIGDNEEALEVAQATYQEAAEMAEKNRPPQAQVDDIPIDQRRALYAAAHQVAQTVLKFAEAHGISFTDNTEEEVNPFYGQTENGFIIEMYYGGPSYLLTPWGKWSCWRSAGDTWKWDELMPELLAELDGFEYEAEVVSDMGHIGPFYGLRRVGDTPLPEPSKRKKSQFIEYDDVKKAWEELTEAS